VLSERGLQVRRELWAIHSRHHVPGVVQIAETEAHKAAMAALARRAGRARAAQRPMIMNDVIAQLQAEHAKSVSNEPSSSQRRPAEVLE
jgi:hypothetical protein